MIARDVTRISPCIAVLQNFGGIFSLLYDPLFDEIFEISPL